jgi:hypothetical protein
MRRDVELRVGLSESNMIVENKEQRKTDAGIPPNRLQLVASPLSSFNTIRLPLITISFIFPLPSLPYNALFVLCLRLFYSNPVSSPRLCRLRLLCLCFCVAALIRLYSIINHFSYNKQLVGRIPMLILPEGTDRVRLLLKRVWILQDNTTRQ